MAEPIANKLEVWDSPGVAVQDIFGLTEEELVDSGTTLRGPHHPREFAQKLYAFESLHPQPAAAPPPPVPSEPYSLQWFLDIENQRHSRHAKWIPKLLEFA